MAFHVFELDLALMPHSSSGPTSGLSDCASNCLMKTTTNGSGCNSFFLDGGNCYLGFLEPNDIMNEAAARTSATKAKLYVNFPMLL